MNLKDDPKESFIYIHISLEHNTYEHRWVHSHSPAPLNSPIPIALTGFPPIMLPSLDLFTLFDDTPPQGVHQMYYIPFQMCYIPIQMYCIPPLGIVIIFMLLFYFIVERTLRSSLLTKF